MRCANVELGGVATASGRSTSKFCGFAASVEYSDSMDVCEMKLRSATSIIGGELFKA